jgi:hypothetical protein
MRFLTVTAACAVALFSGACAHKKSPSGPTTRPMTLRERQDRALRDPFGYKPDFGGDNISGDTGSLDKEGLRKDIDHVFIR